MPDYAEVNVFFIILIASLYGIADMLYRLKRKRIIKELQSLPKPTKLTLFYIDKYKHYFDIHWWHWLSVVGLAVSVVGFWNDSY